MTHSATTAPALAPRTPDRDEAAALHALLRQSPARPVHLRDFFPLAAARRLAAAVRALPDWQVMPLLWLPDRSRTRPADAAEWSTASEGDRAAVRQVAVRIGEAFDDPDALPAAGRTALQDLFVFAAMGPALREHLSDWLAPETPFTTNVEFARYTTGDFLGEHSDTDSDTSFVLNLYLDEQYRPEDGGALGFRAESGTEHSIEPVFNSVSFMPIREGAVHWVTPWLAQRTGRFTVSIAAVPVAA
ncbi:2OG-Fe(II) oxygenase family protein [Dactylosporangium sp. NPDC005555]|uniref:2OG-Fe(II) oxygenase n=1 Tax=Dactylosporangium sp. NPDC005555 TaxID=3154889 RepID=UPI0033A018AA